jgi:hypothetical protein
VGWFRAYGVRECWLVNHLTTELEVLEFADRQLVARRRYAGRMQIESKVLPEIVLAPSDVSAQ